MSENTKRKQGGTLGKVILRLLEIFLLPLFALASLPSPGLRWCGMVRVRVRVSVRVRYLVRLNGCGGVT